MSEEEQEELDERIERVAVHLANLDLDISHDENFKETFKKAIMQGLPNGNFR